MNTAAPGWLPDPTGRHEYRYWDGSQWTDDVSDRGTTSTDPVAGPAPQTTPYGNPAHGDPSAGYGAGGFGAGAYGSGGYPPQQPPRSGPSTGLLVGLGVLVAVLILGLVIVVTTQGDDGNDAQTASNTEDTDDGSATTIDGTPEAPETTNSSTDLGDLGDSGAAGDAMADLMATQLVTASNGVLTQDEADCLATGMIEEIGLGRLIEAGTQVAQNGASNPFDIYTSEELSAISTVLLDCVPADKIAELTDIFGDVVDQNAGGG